MTLDILATITCKKAMILGLHDMVSSTIYGTLITLAL